MTTLFIFSADVLKSQKISTKMLARLDTTQNVNKLIVKREGPNNLCESGVYNLQ